MRSLRLVLLGLGVALLVACNKPDVEECRKACWNGMKVKFWETVDEDAKGLSIEDAAKLRAEREIVFKQVSQRQEDPGLMNCITNCQHQASKEQLACMQTAKTSAKLETCLDL